MYEAVTGTMAASQESMEAFNREERELFGDDVMDKLGELARTTFSFTTEARDKGLLKSASPDIKALHLASALVDARNMLENLGIVQLLGYDLERNYVREMRKEFSLLEGENPVLEARLDETLNSLDRLISAHEKRRALEQEQLLRQQTGKYDFKS